MTQGARKVKGQPDRVVTAPTRPPKPQPDPFDGAEDWLFVVVNPDDESPLRTSREIGLDVINSTSSKLDKWARDKKKVVVVVPGEGQDHNNALDVFSHLESIATVVVKWDVPQLGSDELPDLVSFNKKFPLAISLPLEKPWRSKPSSNGNLRIASAGVDAAAVNGVDQGGRRSYAVLRPLSDEELGLVRASSIQIKPIDWLWEYRLAAGEFAMMAGEPGLGKSQVMLAIASAITNGSDWPGGKTKAPVGSVIILSAEDRPETTIVPRLQAMNANLEKVLILRAKAVRKRDGKESIILPMSFQDLDWWRLIFERVPDARLLIADPIVSYLGKGVNDQRNTEIREILEPFIEDIIRPSGVCFLGNTHLNKSIDSKSPLNRISGSTAYGALPRNVHFVVKDPDNPKQRYFKQCKCNNAPDDLEAIPFQVEQRTLVVGDIKIETSVPIFADKGIELDLQQVLGGDKGRRGPKPVKTNEVAEWLFTRLGEAPLMMRDLVEQAQEAGHIRPASDRHPKPSISILYDASEHIPTLHPGWRVEEDTVEAGVGQGRKPRKRWSLVQDGGAKVQSSLPAF